MAIKKQQRGRVTDYNINYTLYYNGKKTPVTGHKTVRVESLDHAKSIFKTTFDFNAYSLLGLSDKVTAHIDSIEKV